MEKYPRLSFDKFTIVISAPQNRNNALFVTLCKDGRFNMNSRLTTKLAGKRIIVAFTEDGPHLGMKESPDPEAIYIPKNGSKKLEEIKTLLEKKNIDLPAKYIVSYVEEEGFWQGDLSENPILKPLAKSRGSKRN